ncbi:MAG: hypothetical protein B6D44_09030 [Ignavibacteriales bacterium UTCHB2]|nr:MAG: hypothetical protein B6D44_09030 [Ignavibacteriales bacterium UTCHB2]
MKAKVNPEIWEGNLDLRGNKTLTDLGQLKEIKGSAYFENSNIKDLRKVNKHRRICILRKQ